MVLKNFSDCKMAQHKGKENAAGARGIFFVITNGRELKVVRLILFYNVSVHDPIFGCRSTDINTIKNIF